MAKLLHSLSETWLGLSTREKRLALIVAVLVGAMGVYTVIVRAMGYINVLDADIAQLQENIVNYQYLLARRQLVEQQYALVASQHSSEWSEAEILDRLRQEIRRLALNLPPALDANGIPVSATNDSGDLVPIPSLGQGALNETGEGYREFAIDLEVPTSTIDSVVNYVERLQQSPQSLRIDAIEIRRSPLGRNASAALRITRTVVDNPGFSLDADGGLSVGGGAAIEFAPDNWEAIGCELSLSMEFLTAGNQTLRIDGEQTENTAYLVNMFPAGQTYELAVDATTTSSGTMSIATDTASDAFAETVDLETSGEPHRYVLRFTVPAGDSPRTRVRAPAITFAGRGGTVFLSNLVIRPLEAT